MTKKNRNLWRGRLEKEVGVEIRDFISSLEEDKRIVEADLDVAEAHNLMLYKQGLLNRHEISRILEGFEKTRKKWREGRLNLNPAEIDIHPLLEKEVINLCGIRIGGKTHLGKSRNDQVVADVRIYLRKECLDLSEQLLAFLALLLKLTVKHLETLLPGYTHTQEAQVITYAHYLLAYVDLFLRDLERLEQSYERINLNPLGACALAGTGIKIDRNYTAKILGFDGLIENSLDAVSNRDFILEFSANLAILMVNLSRMAEDLILWSSIEFGILKLADELSDISSAMPQKKNPCPLEMIRGKSGTVFAALQNLLIIIKGIPTGYNKDLQETKPPLWSSIDVLHSSLRVMKEALETLRLNKTRCLELTLRNPITALDLAEYLTAKGCCSFREAHFLVGSLVRELIGKCKYLKEVEPAAIEEISGKILGKKIQLDPQELKQVVNPVCSVQRRDSQGGPSASEGKRMLLSRKIMLKRHQQLLNRRKRKIEKSSRLLKNKIASLLCEKN